jgi:hypothetical protein
MSSVAFAKEEALGAQEDFPLLSSLTSVQLYGWCPFVSIGGLRLFGMRSGGRFLGGAGGLSWADIVS